MYPRTLPPPTHHLGSSCGVSPFRGVRHARRSALAWLMHLSSFGASGILPFRSRLWFPLPPQVCVQTVAIYLTNIYGMLQYSGHYSRCWGHIRRLLPPCVEPLCVHARHPPVSPWGHDFLSSSGPRSVFAERANLVMLIFFSPLFTVSLLHLAQEQNQEIELHNYKISQIKFHHCFWFLYAVCWTLVCECGAEGELNATFVW